MKLTHEERDFQHELRAFVREHLPPDIRHKVQHDLLLKKEDHVRWQTILHEKKGWYGGSWPKQYGGAGWSIVQQYLFEQENALGGAPFIVPYGVNMVGPVIYTFGTEEQKQRYLPDILSNRTWWCQGYSEPNAGSDLASLRCAARREGDEYVINGTKMWTTQAQYADMMHILVRTDDSGRKQQGITFLLLDMRSPGVSIVPIVTIDGLHHTNQTFFDEVRVPVANRVGEEGDGWMIARFLLSCERTAIADSGAKNRAVAKLRSHLRALDPQAIRTLQLKLRLAEIETELVALIAMEQRLIAAEQSGGLRGNEPSVLKVRATELQQSISILAADLEGPYKLAYDVGRIERGEMLEAPTRAESASSAAYLYLYGRCASIYGGTNEIQRNIIAKSVLAQSV